MENQDVRASGPARPRNLAVGCFAVLVVLATLALLGRFVRGVESGDEPPVVEQAPTHPLSADDV